MSVEPQFAKQELTRVFKSSLPKEYDFYAVYFLDANGELCLWLIRTEAALDGLLSKLLLKPHCDVFDVHNVLDTVPVDLYLANFGVALFHKFAKFTSFIYTSFL